MSRLHVVDAGSRPLYADALDQHHVIRKEIYIDQHRWRALRAVDGREADQFDTERAVYLLAMDEAGAVMGGTRLLPSLGPTLLSEVFPQLADVRGFERGPDIWEWTRFFVATRHRGDGRLSPVAGIVAAGMVEYCLEEGIPQLNVVAETYWIPKVGELGWRPRPLGLPLAHDGLQICAFSIEMTEEALETTRAVYGIESTNLLHRARRPAAAERPLVVRH